MAELFAADPDLLAPADVPDRILNYSLEVFEEMVSGWRAAAIVRNADSPDFFLRSISVAWPFLVARPRPSTRQSGVLLPRDMLSPARTTPAQKLVVNWHWELADDATEQLRFFVRCRGPLLFWPIRRLRVRLGLKQQSIARRHVVRLVSKPIDWRSHGVVQFVAGADSMRA